MSNILLQSCFKFYARLTILLNFDVNVEEELEGWSDRKRAQSCARTCRHTQTFMPIQLTYGNGLWKFFRCQPSVSSIGRTKAQRIIIMRLCATDFLFLLLLALSSLLLLFTLRTPCAALFISHNVKAIPMEQFISRVDTTRTHRKGMCTMRKWQKPARYYPIIDFKRSKNKRTLLNFNTASQLVSSNDNVRILSNSFEMAWIIKDFGDIFLFYVLFICLFFSFCLFFSSLFGCCCCCSAHT